MTHLYKPLQGFAATLASVGPLLRPGCIDGTVYSSTLNDP